MGPNECEPKCHEPVFLALLIHFNSFLRCVAVECFFFRIFFVFVQSSPSNPHYCYQYKYSRSQYWNAQLETEIASFHWLTVQTFSRICISDKRVKNLILSDLRIINPNLSPDTYPKCLNNGEPCAKKVKPSDDKKAVQGLKTRLLRRCEEINDKTFEHYSIFVTCEVTIFNKNGDSVDYGKTGEKSRREILHQSKWSDQNGMMKIIAMFNAI